MHARHPRLVRVCVVREPWGHSANPSMIRLMFHENTTANDSERLNLGVTSWR